MTPEEYRDLAHSESLIECHAIAGPQCAGAAIYRANVAKVCRDKAIIKLPANRERVFSTPMEFVEHHSSRPRKPKRKGKQ